MLKFEPMAALSPDEDALRQIQLRVAQRADEIARQRTYRSPLNLDCWLLAEAEYFRGSADFSSS